MFMIRINFDEMKWRRRATQRKHEEGNGVVERFIFIYCDATDETDARSLNKILAKMKKSTITQM